MNDLHLPPSIARIRSQIASLDSSTTLTEFVAECGLSEWPGGWDSTSSTTGFTGYSWWFDPDYGLHAWFAEGPGTITNRFGPCGISKAGVLVWKQSPRTIAGTRSLASLSRKWLESSSKEASDRDRSGRGPSGLSQPLKSCRVDETRLGFHLMNRDDRELLDSFEKLTLPLTEWNQRAHVSIAYLYLREHGFNDALDLMRRGVKAFNKHHGIVDSPTSGYNETTTVAFLRIISALDNAYDSALPTQCSKEFCDSHPQLMSKHVLRFFYSPSQRMHPEAKTKFVEPDLTPLP